MTWLNKRPLYLKIPPLNLINDHGFFAHGRVKGPQVTLEHSMYCHLCRLFDVLLYILSSSSSPNMIRRFSSPSELEALVFPSADETIAVFLF